MASLAETTAESADTAGRTDIVYRLRAKVRASGWQRRDRAGRVRNEIVDGAHTSLRREPGSALAGAFAHAPGRVGMVEHPADSASQTLRVFIIDNQSVLAVGDEIDGPAAADRDRRFAQVHGVEARLLPAGVQQALLHGHDNELRRRHRLAKAGSRRPLDANMIRQREVREQFTPLRRDPYLHIERPHGVDQCAIIAVVITTGEQITVIADLKFVVVKRMVKRDILQLLASQAESAGVILDFMTGPNDESMNRPRRQAKAQRLERAPQPRRRRVPQTIDEDVRLASPGTERLQPGEDHAA